MATKNKPESVSEWFRRKIYERFGFVGLLVLALLTSVVLLISNWNDIKTWPVVSSVVNYTSRWSVPRAATERFSVMVAHLENDENHENEHLIVEALKEFEGIQVLNLDRTIPLDDPVPEKAEKRGHLKAQTYLNKSGASVLIWGRILTRNGQSVYKLYWTAQQNLGKKSTRYDAPLVEDQFRLPELFWNDLIHILHLSIVTSYGRSYAERGVYVADQLQLFIPKVEALFSSNGESPGWNEETRGLTLNILADAYYTLGIQKGQNEYLEKTVAICMEILQERTRERVPLDWAMTQNNLGNVLTSMEERENNTDRLKQAVAAYTEALKERTRERVPLDWAMTQNNLGFALSRKGERENNTDQLEQAITAYSNALEVFKEAKATYYIEMAKNNLRIAEELLKKLRS